MREPHTERRSGVDRRRITPAAYFRGALRPRRRGGRRAQDLDYPIVDWLSPRLLAVALAILGLCILDGVLTVMLMALGATEVNPFMALFLPDRPGWFAVAKLSLTGLGILVLVACSRVRLFHAIPAEVLLYVVLAAYSALVIYELKLLEAAQSAIATESDAR